MSLSLNVKCSVDYLFASAFVASSLSVRVLHHRLGKFVAGGSKRSLLLGLVDGLVDYQPVHVVNRADESSAHSGY